MRTGTKIGSGLLVLLLLFVMGAGLWIKDEMHQIPVSDALLDTYFTSNAQTPVFASSVPHECADNNPLNNAYFGALHVHTALSADAYGFGVTNMPDDFYRFARGGELELRLQKEAGDVPTLRLDRPLDFAAVTDHAVNLGEQALCLDPDFAGRNGLICNVFRGEWTLPVEPKLSGIVRMLAFIGLQKGRPAKLCGDDGSQCLERATDIWTQTQEAAERWYDRSDNCAFSTFVAYEYSLAKEGTNLHRNVIFKNATVPPTPLSSKDVMQPRKLWQWLDRYCAESGTGCDAVSIPHNSNWSSGRMFFPYSLQDMPEKDRHDLANLRARYEVLVETMQVKGDSECRNGLSSVMGGADELCDFEKLRPPEEDFDDCGDQIGSGGMRLSGCLSQYSYARYALAAGLEEERNLGVNPFKFGLIAATDNHNGAGGAVAEDEFFGAAGMDRVADRRTGPPITVPGGIAKGSPIHYNPGGIAGIWAPHNTREALFDGMRRRETFGTSGPRITPRFFGGWGLDKQLCEQDQMIATAYDTAVPMGSDLPSMHSGQAAPSFLLSATQDLTTGATPLQRLQVIKTWSDREGQTHQAVFDVAGDANNGATVDTSTCQRRGSGFAELCTVWQDPEFSPSTSAAYYARVIENPSCRWLAYDCMNASPENRPQTCDDPVHRKSIQERAWTSPIWYTAKAEQPD